jgi:hypothetical protein
LQEFQSSGEPKYRIDFFLFECEVVATQAAGLAPACHISAAVAVGDSIFLP